VHETTLAIVASSYTESPRTSGFVVIARALLDCGAAAGAKDMKGDTPLQRALNCRRKTLQAC